MLLIIAKLIVLLLYCRNKLSFLLTKTKKGNIKKNFLKMFIYYDLFFSFIVLSVFFYFFCLFCIIIIISNLMNKFKLIKIFFYAFFIHFTHSLSVSLYNLWSMILIKIVKTQFYFRMATATTENLIFFIISFIYFVILVRVTIFF